MFDCCKSDIGNELVFVKLASSSGSSLSKREEENLPIKHTHAVHHRIMSVPHLNLQVHTFNVSDVNVGLQRFC